ncbi:sel1 repeat family protein [Pseudoalteromonas sp. SMS1]|uniref:tetratricopeptide repeat protein n=1 Tax=Pseudoalteromonas sp. SMS1 TaxID=2908894 RepID=UPI001F25D8DF|nr:tetratricopeptide repeat protein [Pseudoalteromonas sp. SMS1]MCF2856144.1 sel1 repeat family protein [Pseudoalteromonas sp. SMS1]
MKLLAVVLCVALLAGCNATSKPVNQAYLFIEPDKIPSRALVAQSHFLLSKEAHRLKNFHYEFALLIELADHQYGPAQLAIAKRLLSGHGREYVDGTALEWVLKAVENEHVPAITYLAKWYRYGGYGLKMDLKKSMALYAQAVDLGEPAAATELGYIFLEYWRTDKGYETAKQLLANAAYFGETKALCGLGRVYQESGTLRDIPKAAEYFEISYLQGYKLCAFELGHLHHKITDNYALAHRWYRKAALAGSAEAVNNRGKMFEQGQGVDPDFVVAKSYFEQAAELGNPSSFGNLGRLYELGKGVAQNFEQAIGHYQVGVLRKDAQSMHHLGGLYQTGQGVKQNKEKAMSLFKEAAALGNAFSAFHLGNALKQGEGTEQDTQLALEYYIKSAKLGYAKAYCYAADIVIDQDWRQAKSYYFEGAKQGQGVCAEKLTHYMRVRQEQDLPIITLLISLAHRGVALAHRELGAIYQDGDFGEQIDLEKAQTYYLQAAQQEDDIALNKLGIIYRDGLKVAVDNERALNYFKRSAELGLPDAMHNLGALNLALNQYSKGLVWLLRAAKQNHSESYILLGEYYASQNADGAAQQEAFKWLQRAADDQLPEGMYQLAMLLKKQNSNQLTPEATKWLKAAASSGHIKARSELSDSDVIAEYEK